MLLKTPVFAMAAIPVCTPKGQASSTQCMPTSSNNAACASSMHVFPGHYYVDGPMLNLLVELLLFFLRSIALVPERSVSSPFRPMDAVDIIGAAWTVSVTGLPGI